MSPDRLAPDEALRLAYVGKRYFVDSRTRVQIADELQISRFAVARMLQKAVETGIVSISIAAPGGLNADLSLSLIQRYGLKNALVVATPAEDPEQVRKALGAMMAEYLSSVTMEGDILGLGSGRTLIEMSRVLTTIAHCDVVQIAGVADPVRERGLEMLTAIGRRSGGAVFALTPPSQQRDEKSREAVPRRPYAGQRLPRVDKLTRAVVTIGAWPSGSLLHDSLMQTSEADKLIKLGVVAEVGTTLLDAEGAVITKVAHRMGGITAGQLRTVPQVIGVGGGTAKHAAVRSVLKAGVLSDLVTDEATARFLLS